MTIFLSFLRILPKPQAVQGQLDKKQTAFFQKTEKIFGARKTRKNRIFWEKTAYYVGQKNHETSAVVFEQLLQG